MNISEEIAKKSFTNGYMIATKRLRENFFEKLTTEEYKKVLDIMLYNLKTVQSSDLDYKWHKEFINYFQNEFYP